MESTTYVENTYTIICKAPNTKHARACSEHLTAAYPGKRFVHAKRTNHVLVVGELSVKVKDDMQMICLGVGIQNEIFSVYNDG